MKHATSAMHEVIAMSRAVMAAEQAVLTGARNLADFSEMVRLSEALLVADRNLALARKKLHRATQVPGRSSAMDATFRKLYGKKR